MKQRYFYDVIQMDNLCKVEDEYWFIDRRENALYKYDIKTGICQLVLLLPSDCSLTDGKGTYLRNTPYCFCVKDTLYCLPDRGNKIILVNRMTLHMECIEIQNRENVRHFMHSMWVLEDTIWLYSYGLGKILKLNAKKKCVEEEYSIFDKKERPGFEVILVNHYIYSVSQETNAICKFDILNGEKKIIRVKGATEGFFTICHYDKSFWLSGMSGKIYKWDEETGVLELIDLRDIEFKVYNKVNNQYIQIEMPLQEIENPVFYRSVMVGDYICFIPYNCSGAFCSQLLCINNKTKEQRVIDLIEMHMDKEGSYTICFASDDDIIGISCSQNDYISKIDLNNGTISGIRMKIDELSLEQIMPRHFERGAIIENQISLHIYISSLNLSKQNVKSNVNCGDKIWYKIKV